MSSSKRSRSANFGAGRRESAKAAEQWAQQQHDKAISRRYGSLASEADKRLEAQRRREASGPRAKSLAQQSAEHKRKQAPKKRRRRRKASPGGHRSDDPRYQARSVYYGYGVTDGREDCRIVAQCPPGMPQGPDPERAWSAMYRAGYEQEWAHANAHICTRECRKEG